MADPSSAIVRHAWKLAAILGLALFVGCNTAGPPPVDDEFLQAVATDPFPTAEEAGIQSARD